MCVDVDIVFNFLEKLKEIAIMIIRMSMLQKRKMSRKHYDDGYVIVDGS